MCKTFPRVQVHRMISPTTPTPCQQSGNCPGFPGYVTAGKNQGLTSQQTPRGDALTDWQKQGKTKTKGIEYALNRGINILPTSLFPLPLQALFLASLLLLLSLALFLSLSAFALPSYFYVSLPPFLSSSDPADFQAINLNHSGPPIEEAHSLFFLKQCHGFAFVCKLNLQSWHFKTFVEEIVPRRLPVSSNTA